jgi:hypothetical protein
MNSKDRIIEFLSFYEETMKRDKDINIENIKISDKIISRIELDGRFELLEMDLREKDIFRPSQSEMNIIKRSDLSNYFRDLEYYRLADSNRIVNEYYTKIPIIYKAAIAFGAIIMIVTYLYKDAIGVPITFMGIIGGLGILSIASLGSLEVIYNISDLDIEYYRFTQTVREKINNTQLIIRKNIYNASHYWSLVMDQGILKFR